MQSYKCLGVPRSFLYKPNSNTIMTAIFNSPQSTHKLFSAIKTLTQIHPLLRVSLQIDEHGEAWLNESSDNTYEIFISSEQEETIVTRSLCSPINPLEDKLCQFILLGDNDNCRGITVVCHHIICDGISVLNLFRDISRLLYDDNPSYDYSVEILRKELLPKPIIGRLGMLYIRKQNAIWENKAIERTNKTYNKIKGTYLNQKVFNITDFTLKEDESAFLFKMAKQNDLSVNSLLIGLILASELKTYPSTNYRNKFSLAINLRPFLKKDVKEQFGYFASGIQLAERISMNKFINDVKRLERRIKKKMNSSNAFKLQSLELFHHNFIDAVDLNIYGLRDDVDIHKWIKLTKMDTVSTACVVSNLGKVDWINKNPIYKKILGPYMVAETTEKYIGITTINSMIHISISYIDKIIESRLISRFKEVFLNNVNSLMRKTIAQR